MLGSWHLRDQNLPVIYRRALFQLVTINFPNTQNPCFAEQMEPPFYNNGRSHLGPDRRRWDMSRTSAENYNFRCFSSAGLKGEKSCQRQASIVWPTTTTTTTEPSRTELYPFSTTCYGSTFDFKPLPPIMQKRSETILIAVPNRDRDKPIASCPSLGGGS